MRQINLNNFKVITDKLNTFFVDNKFMVASEIPTTGEFKVGDIIINNGPTNVDEPMWICVEAGNPGTWTVFNSGGGSGGKLTTARNRVVLNGESKSEVFIGVSGFNKASDVLMVFINSRFMTEGVDYEINADSTKIVAIGEVWNEELASEFEIEMIVFKMMGEEGVVSSVNEIVKLKNTVIVNESVNEVEIGIEGFNEDDDLTVYRNSVYMIEGIDYEIQGNKIVSLKGAWNAEGGSDYKFTFEVLKAVAKVNPDAVVGMEHLTEDVKEAIEAAGNIDLSGYATKEELNNIDMSGKQDKVDNSLVTNNKSIVGAINELFQDVDSGKGIIADAIDDRSISKDSTFAAMGEVIEEIVNDKNTMKQKLVEALVNKGVDVDNTTDYDSLINEIQYTNIKFFIMEENNTDLINKDGVWLYSDNPITNISLAPEVMDDSLVAEGEVLVYPSTYVNSRYNVVINSGIKSVFNIYKIEQKVNSEYVELVTAYHKSGDVIRQINNYGVDLLDTTQTDCDYTIDSTQNLPTLASLNGLSCSGNITRTFILNINSGSYKKCTVNFNLSCYSEIWRSEEDVYGNYVDVKTGTSSYAGVSVNVKYMNVTQSVSGGYGNAISGTHTFTIDLDKNHDIFDNSLTIIITLGTFVYYGGRYVPVVSNFTVNSIIFE